MAWPMSQDYNEAIQNPAHCFADPALRQGEAVTNALGLPIPCSGNFADVYAVVAGPSKWAVKCFTREIPGLKERYAAVSQYLQQVPLPFMVDFRFLEQGIRVRGQWFPILKMQWVEGLALNAFVRDNLDKPQVLDAMCQIWLRLAVRLREANIAHCDLQHGNVLMVQGASAGKLGVRLVDYDGTCVPALELLKSIEVGHPAYQHPQRLREATYGLEIDRFPHLVIYTAIRAIMAGGKSLWQKFDNGDNLLFRQTDFASPRTSALFQELLKLNDPQVKKLAQAVAVASQKPIDQVPLLEQLVDMPRPKPASTAVTAAPERRTATANAGSQAALAAENPFAGVDDDGAMVEPRRRTQYRGGRKRGLALAAVAAVGLLVTAAAAGYFVLLPKTRPQAVELAQAAASKPTKNPTEEPSNQGATKPDTKATPQPSLVPKFDSIPVPKFEPKIQPAPEPQTRPQPTPVPQPVSREGWPKPGVLEGHTGKVTGVAFSGDGKFIASCSEDKTVRQWGLGTGKESGRYEGNQQLTEDGISLAASADGSSLCAYSKFEFTIYDFLSRRQLNGLHQIDKRVPFAAMVYDPGDSNRIVRVDSNGLLSTYQFKRGGGRSWTGFPGIARDVNAVASSSNARFIFIATATGTLEVWEMDNFQQPLRRIDGHKGAIRSLAASPDGKLLVSSGADNTVRLWETETGKDLRQFQAGTVPCVAFSPDGRRILTGGQDKTVRVWDAQTAGLLQSFKGHTDSVSCVAFSSDGSLAVSGSADHTVRLWKIDKGALPKPVRQPVVTDPKPKADPGERTGALRGHTGKVTGVLFSADGKYVASASEDKTVRQWDAASGKESGRYEGLSGEVLGLTQAPDGKSFCGFTKLALNAWDFDSRKPVQDFDGFNRIMELRQKVDPLSISSAVYDPRSGRLGVGSPDGVESFVFQGKAFTGQNFGAGRGGAVTHLVSSADGKRYFTGSPDGTLTIWDAEQRALVQSIAAHRGAIRALAVSSDAKLLLTSGADNTARLWEVETRKQLRSFQGHTGEVLGVAFSPNARRILTAGADRTVRLWDARTGREVRKFKGHSDAVTCVAISPNGKAAVSGSADKTLRLWQLPP